MYNARMTPQEKAAQRRRISPSYPLLARILLSIAFCMLFAIMFYLLTMPALPNALVSLALSWMFYKALA